MDDEDSYQTYLYMYTVKTDNRKYPCKMLTLIINCTNLILTMGVNTLIHILKANRPQLCNDLHMPTDYKHTDKHLRLVNGPAMRGGTDRRTDGHTDPPTDRMMDRR